MRVLWTQRQCVLKIGHNKLHFSISRDVFKLRSQDVEQLLAREMAKEGYERLKLKYIDLNKGIQYKTLWDDSATGAQLSREFVDAQRVIEYFENIQHDFKNILDMYSLGEEEDDAEILATCANEMEDMHNAIRGRVLERIMSNIEDSSSCYAEIIAGVGGLDAYDWTRMLALMYANWASSVMNFSVKYVDEQVAEGASSWAPDIYRRVTLRFDGPNAYGYLKAEAGVHRLVRRSPFDPSDKRHTSFAQVQIYPAPPEDDRDRSGGTAAGFYVDLRCPCLSLPGHISTSTTHILICTNIDPFKLLVSLT